MTYYICQNNISCRYKGEDQTYIAKEYLHLRYIHDGSEVLSDSFTLSVFDGNNRVSKVFNIEIVPIDDEAPRVQDNLRANLIVSEGSIAVISSVVLAATDEDTDDGKLIFLIVKQPK